MNCYDIFHCPAIDYSAGCAILFKKDLQYRMCSVLESAEAGRLLVANVLIYNLPWRIIVVYAYNDVKQRELLFSQVRIHADTRFNVILLGDFNCVLNVRDRTPTRKIEDHSTDILKATICDCDMFDSSTIDSSLKYTHFQGSSHARLDRIYVSGSVSNSLSNYKVIPVFFSDHCMVMVNVGAKKNK